MDDDVSGSPPLEKSSLISVSFINGMGDEYWPQGALEKTQTVNYRRVYTQLRLNNKNYSHAVSAIKTHMLYKL